MSPPPVISWPSPIRESKITIHSLSLGRISDLLDGITSRSRRSVVTRIFAIRRAHDTARRLRRNRHRSIPRDHGHADERADTAERKGDDAAGREARG